MRNTSSYRVEAGDEGNAIVLHSERTLAPAMNWARKDPVARERVRRGESLRVVRVQTSLVHEVRRH